MEQIVGGLISFFISLLVFFLWIILIIIVMLAVKTIIAKVLFRRFLDERLFSTDIKYLLIKIPPNNEQREEAMEAFLHSLHRVLPSGTLLSLEMVSANQFLRFYIAIPRNQKNVLESQLYAQYPDAEIEDADDRLGVLDENMVFAEIGFKNSSVYSINTYHHLKEDLLKNLSAILSKTAPHEKAFVQLALKRIGSYFWERGFKKSPKLSGDLFSGKLRVAYIAQDSETAKEKLKTLLGLFKSVEGPENRLIKTTSLLQDKVNKPFQARVFEKGDFWSIPELVTLYHFPYKGSFVSNIVQTSSKRAPSPDILPQEGTVDSKEISIFGETNYRNERKRFGVKRIDRRRHLYVVGKTGSGKSKLLELLLISDILSGQGCCLVDPHGDLAEEILKFIPKERVKDVVYVNPADREFPIGFNPLEPVEDYEVKQQLSTFFISIFKKLFAASWNQRMEHLIRYITLALLETPDSNILGIPRMLSDTTFRQRVIKQIKDPVVKGFWTNEFSTSAEQYSREAVVPILNKVGQFIANPVVRNMIGQKRNSLNFEKFMNEGKIVLLNISKGRLGDENTALLGAMFITKIQQAALSRAKVSEDQRRDFYFYIDEFQNFATEAFSSILSEARKYHLNLTIAHQYIAQLPDDVKATAFGNVGSLIVFPVGGDDAEYLEKEFSPVFRSEDLISLNVREMYIKMSVDGKLTAPFSARTIDVPRPQFNHVPAILSHSRLTYGKNRVSVENEIRKWSEASQPISSDSSEEFPEPIL